MSRESGRGSIPPLPQRVDHPLVDPPDIQFWTNMRSMEVTSSECLAEVQALLSSPSKITLARSFRGNEAQMFIDFLNQVSIIMPVVLPQLMAPSTGTYVVMPR